VKRVIYKAEVDGKRLGLGNYHGEDGIPAARIVREWRNVCYYGLDGVPCADEQPDFPALAGVILDYRQVQSLASRFPGLTFVREGQTKKPGDGKAPAQQADGGAAAASKDKPTEKAKPFVQIKAVLRGGGHRGKRRSIVWRPFPKQHTFDDFIACAEELVRSGVTTSEKLAIGGGSNGGLLVGAALTQRPDLFGAVLCDYPLLDMLRYHRFSWARFWVPEYGSAEDPEQYRWLRAYSPYHHLQAGVKYPAVLFTSGDGDTRVAPLHARKMAARMQESTSSDRPVLVRIETKAGHGVGKPRHKQLEELADEWTFFFRELGLAP